MLNIKFTDGTHTVIDLDNPTHNGQPIRGFQEEDRPISLDSWWEGDRPAPAGLELIYGQYHQHSKTIQTLTT